MKTICLLIVALLLTVPVAAQETPCAEIVGTWKWFVGPQLIVKVDHTFSNNENSGSWELSNAAVRKYTLRWDVGGFVDEVILSADGLKLTGTNDQKNNVAGERIGKCVSN